MFYVFLFCILWASVPEIKVSYLFYLKSKQSVCFQRPNNIATVVTGYDVGPVSFHIFIRLNIWKFISSSCYGSHHIDLPYICHRFRVWVLSKCVRNV